jgi:hypothetical protein
MLNFKNKLLRFEKKSLKSLFLIIICNLNTLTNGNTKVKFVLIILYKIHVGSETN